MNLLKILKKLIVEQDQDSEWIVMEPDEFKDLLKIVNYNGDLIPKIRDYKNKSIKVNGNLNLRETPTKSLGNLKQVTGQLDLSGTQIRSVAGIQARYISYFNTPLWRHEENIKRQKILAIADGRREDEEWSLENADQEGLAANALFNYLVGVDKIDVKGPDDLNRIKYLESELNRYEELEKQYEDEEKDLTDIHANIEVINDEIEELNNKLDVYNVIPIGTHYDLHLFKIVGGDYDEDKEWAVGNEHQTEESAKEYNRSLIEDTGIPEYFHNDEDVMDMDRIEEIIRDHYEYDVRESPESYFNDDDYELTDEQEKYKASLESQLAALEEKQNNLENEIEEPSEYSNAYDEVQEQIDEIQEKIDELEPNKEPTEQMIDDKVEDLVSSHIRRGRASEFLQEMGYDLKDFYDIDKVVDEIIRIDGYGSISSYDGDYNTEDFNGETYYIFRIN